MARIGVMTFLHNDNYGSTLQAWALLQTLSSLGHDAEDIDYAPSRMEKIRNLLRSGNSPRLILEGMRKRRASGQRPAGFAAFRDVHMRLSKPCLDHKALKVQAGTYDLLLCGSDQVWSPHWLNPAYFLDFTKKPRLAYACSLGVKELPPRRKQRIIRRLVKGFSAVSVREDEGAALMEKMTGCRPCVMPDPVMLADQMQWKALADYSKADGKYLLCYFIGENPVYWDRVRKEAEESGLSVKVISMTQEARESGFEIVSCDPAQWLGMIDHAEILVTDSFHGACFASILNRPFVMIRRYAQEDRQNKNSRIDQLLRTLSLSEENKTPDWAAVNERLSEVAEKGKHWLDCSIREALEAPAEGVKTK